MYYKIAILIPTMDETDKDSNISDLKRKSNRVFW